MSEDWRLSGQEQVANAPYSPIEIDHIMTIAPPSNSSVRLLVDTETLDWIAVIDEDVWLLGDRRSALILCGYARVSTAQEEFKRARESCLGRIFVREEESEANCRISFVDWRGAAAREDLHLTAVSEDLHFATWAHGMHTDGWVDVSSALHIEGANRVTLNLYLPTTEMLPDAEKDVDFMVDEQTFHTARVSRGELNTLVLTIDGLAAGGRTVKIEAEYAEPLAGTNDARLLGFLVVGMSLERVDTDTSGD